MSDTRRNSTLPAGSFTVWQLVLSVLWFGMVFAIAFIEAPLKFQAPGITIPLGLGIGRLVFAALNISEAVILILLLIISFKGASTRLGGVRLKLLIGLIVVYVSKVAIVRPPLNSRTDLVLQGADPGQSPWHYIYIGLDLVLLTLLLWFILKTVSILKNSLSVKAEIT
ncbi:MAG TPA: hypothetical protein VLZ31_06780 [Microbacteriaceae bacterium]|nr:hypothetical protein [Microbacteriaceae bacterium]